MGVLTDLSIRLSANTAELNSGLQKAASSVSGFKSNVNKSGKDVSNAFSNMKKNATGALGEISKISPAASSAASGLQKLSLGAKALNVALGPVGLVLGAIALVIKALTSYFKGTVDGAEKFASIMGYVNGILTVVKDGFIALGRFIVKAFEDPKQAISDLWEALKTNLVNRWEGLVAYFSKSFEFLKNGFTALGLTIAGIFSAEKREEAKKYWEEAKKSLVDMGDAALQFYTGMDKAQRTKVIDNLAKGVKKIKDTAEENAKIDLEALQLRKDRAEWILQEKKLEAELAEQKRIASDKENYTVEEREDAIARIRAIYEEIGNKNIKFANKEVELQQRLMDLGENSIEDEEKLLDLKGKQFDVIKNIESQQREIDSIEREIIGSNKTKNKQLSDEYNWWRLTAERSVEVHKKTEDIKGSLAGIGQITDKMDILSAVDAAVDAKLPKSISPDDWLPLDALQRVGGYKLPELTIEKVDVTSVEQATSRFEKFANIAQARLDELKQDLGSLASEIGDVFMTSLSAVSMFMDANMEKELQAVGDNEEKIQKIKEKYAKKQKRISMAQAIINGAVAITKTLAELGLLGIPLSAAIAAQTAAQVAVINATQPFAKGGLAYGPTMGLVGEYPGARTNPEVIAPLDKLESILGNQGGTVVFEIGYDKLIGVLQNGTKLKQTF